MPRHPEPRFYSTRPAFVMSMDLVNRAAEMRGVPPWRVARRERTRPISYTRFGVVWVMRQFGVHFSKLANLLAMADHTSVLFAYQRAEELRAADPDYRKYTDDLLAYALTKEPQPESEEAA
jgi:chromosomal replication initiation ATPase DnaA